MLGHKSTQEDKPYLSYNRKQIAFCAIVFMKYQSQTGYMQEVVGMTINDYLKDYLIKMFREAAGYATATYKVTLMPFIDFCCFNYKDAGVLTSDMLDEWLAYKGYTLNTQAAFIACLRQYCRYISFLGTKAYVPLLQQGT